MSSFRRSLWLGAVAAALLSFPATPVAAQAPGECSVQTGGLCCVCAYDALHDGVCCAPVRAGVPGAVRCVTVGANGYTCDGDYCWIQGHCHGSGGGGPTDPPIIVLQYKLDGAERAELDSYLEPSEEFLAMYSVVDDVTYARHVCDGAILERFIDASAGHRIQLQLSEIYFDRPFKDLGMIDRAVATVFDADDSEQR